MRLYDSSDILFEIPRLKGVIAGSPRKSLISRWLVDFKLDHRKHLQVDAKSKPWGRR
jgi:hypothetical protein